LSDRSPSVAVISNIIMASVFLLTEVHQGVQPMACWERQ